MNKILSLIVMLSFTCTVAIADQYVNGYYNNNGTYVNGYYRTTPDNNPYNNYSTIGNTNPYTGQSGTVDPYSYNNSYNSRGSSSSYSYGANHQTSSYGIGANHF